MIRVLNAAKLWLKYLSMTLGSCPDCRIRSYTLRGSFAFVGMLVNDRRDAAGTCRIRTS